MHPGPGIAGIKSLEISWMIKRIAFCQPEQRFYFFQRCSCFYPKIQLHPKSKITTEAINITFLYPKLHSGNHGFTQIRIIKIQFDNIIHAAGFFKIIRCSVSLIIIRAFHRPHMIPACMIGHPI